MENKKEYKDLTSSEKEIYLNKIQVLLRYLVYCDRDWTAWEYGTMKEKDFLQINECEELIKQRAEELYNFTIDLQII